LSFTTTLTPSNPLQEDFVVEKVVYNWETSATSGSITNNDVTNLTLNLFGSGNSLLFTDAMIIGGVAQSIGGVSRSLNNIQWNFDLDTLNVTAFDNDIPVVQQLSTGITYNVYGGGFLTVNRFNDGSFTETDTYSSFSQSTVAQDVPEPVTILGTLLAGSLGVAFKKKQKAKIAS
jgi:hypothetical protein